VAVVSSGLRVRGQISVNEDLVIDGQIDGGPIFGDGVAIVVAANAVVNCDILARDITVYGSVSGTLLAKDIVDIRESARVTGRIVSTKIILADGALFNGTVQPEQLEAVIRVAQHRYGDWRAAAPVAAEPVRLPSRPPYGVMTTK
jgi:cytoskeletal protein CcmA (bactofilin family)